MKAFVFFVAALLSQLAFPHANQAADAERFNVLFIAVDDLRPTLGCYGDTVAVSPQIDRLAARSTVFTRAYCQQAVCSPSRLSLLSGRRPDTIRVWDLKTHFRRAIPDLVTLPQHFKESGYFTQSIGKIYHGSGKPSKDPLSWSVEPILDAVRSPTMRYATPENLAGSGLKRASLEAAEVPDNTYTDGVVCEEAIAAIESIALQPRSRAQPFFLAVGFRKPHLPFCAPQKYWDLYQRREIPKPQSIVHPERAPDWATRSWKELEGYTDIPDNGQVSPEQVQRLRHGYYACVSYVDAQIGLLLKRLETLELSNNTVIILWGDHGFHLGEQGLWTKANNYELATRVPLIISLPGQQHGMQCDRLVELVDVYPTLAEACNLTIPEELEGQSFVPLLKNPNQNWKNCVYSQFPRPRTGSRHSGHGDVMGYAVRTSRYRYVEWREWDTKKLLATELYDHDSDPLESINISQEIGRAKLIAQLSRLVKDGFSSARR